MVELDGGIHNIDGFMIDKYKSVLSSISGHSWFFSMLFSLDIIITACFLVYLFLSEELLPQFIILLALQIIASFINIMCYKISMTRLQQKTLKNTLKFFFFHFLYCVLQVDFVLYYRFCKSKFKEVTAFQYKNVSTMSLRIKYRQLVQWYSIKRFYLLFKSYLYLIYLIFNEDNSTQIDYYIITGLFAFQSFFYISLNHVYLKLFVFQSKLTFFYNLLTLVESTIQFAQSYCFFIAILYHSGLRITIFCLVIVYTTIIKCQVQHQGSFNPLCIDLFQQIFMGQKLTYIATLFNGDIYQQDIMFMNVFNIVQFIVSQLYSIIHTVIVLYFKTLFFPEYLVNLQLALLIASLCVIAVKIIQIKNRFIQSKSYSIQHLQSLNNKYIENRKCKLNVYVSSRVEEKDWQLIKNLLNIDCKQLHISFSEQYIVNKVLGYSILEINDFESACLQKIYLHLLQNSIYFNIKINHTNPDLQQSKTQQAKSFLFSSLRNTSIEDQKKINMENSELVQYFQNEKFYGEISSILRDFNYQKQMIKCIAFYKHISHYQFINSTMVLFDLYDN